VKTAKARAAVEAPPPRRRRRRTQPAIGG
jgi:hypothetical protein